MGYYNSFVLKIWTDEQERKVRGHILHVSSQEGVYFLNVDKMVDFIMAHLQPPSDSALENEENEIVDNIAPQLGNSQ